LSAWLHPLLAAIPKRCGRPTPAYSFTHNGKKVSDEQSKEWLCELVCGDGFPYAAWQKEIWFRDPMNSGKWMVLPKLRTDNGPQFVARQFQQL